MSGPYSRRLSGPHANKDVGTGTVSGAGGGGKVESGKTRDGRRSGGKSDTESGEIDISSPEDKGEGEASIPSPFRKKRAASEGWEGRSPKRGKMPPSSGSGLEGDAVE